MHTTYSGNVPVLVQVRMRVVTRVAHRLCGGEARCDGRMGWDETG